MMQKRARETGPLFLLSAENETTANQDGLTRHVIGIADREIDDKTCDSVHCLHMAERDSLEIFLIGRPECRAADFGHAIVDRDPHVGFDDVGAVGINRDARGGQLLGGQLVTIADIGRWGYRMLVECFDLLCGLSENAMTAGTIDPLFDGFHKKSSVFQK